MERYRYLVKLYFKISLVKNHNYRWPSLAVQ